MTSPPRRKVGPSLPPQYPPIQTEALGLSIHPVNQDSSPPLASMQPNILAGNGSKQRGSQLRNPALGLTNAPPGPSALSQEVHSSSFGSSHPDPPSPSHTPPSPLPTFIGQGPQQQSPPQQPQIQQSPPQMAALQQPPPTQLNSGFRAPNRIPPPSFEGASPPNPSGNTSGRNSIDANWVSPSHADDPLPDSRVAANRRKGSDEQQALGIREWDRERIRATNGSIGDAMALRSSPTAQLNQQQSQQSAANRNGPQGPVAPVGAPRPKGPNATSSSPVSSMTNTQRQQQQQPSPSMVAASASQVRKEVSQLQGLIAPHVSPTIPLLGRSQTENAGIAAIAAGVRPVLTPPTSTSYGNAGTTSHPTSPPRRGEASGSYHTPMESPPTNGVDSRGSSYNGATSAQTSYSSSRPFEYDREEDPTARQAAIRRAQMEEWKRKDSYGRDRSPSPLHLKPQQLSQSHQSQQHQSPPQQPAPPPAREQQQQYQPQPVRHQSLDAAPVVGQAGGSQIRGVMRFPVHEEFDDEGEGDVQVAREPAAFVQNPSRWPGPPQHSHSQPPAASHYQQQYNSQTQHHSYSQERRRETKPPSPPPAEPIPHPPIPLMAPKSIQAAQAPILAQQRDSTPSPPAAPASLQSQSAPEELEPAEASSDHHTPKSPNAPLPADHGYSYSNNNAGRFSYGGSQYGYRDANAYAGLQHQLFAMQMQGMPMPRGPMQNYAARESFVSLGGAAQQLQQVKPESPYPPPLPPPSINTSNLNGSTSGGQSGYSGSADRTYPDTPSSVGAPNRHGGDNWDYEQGLADFMEYQRRFGSQRPEAPVPPTPQYATNQGQQGRQPQVYGGGSGGGNNNMNGPGSGNNNQNVNDYGNNGYGMGGIWDPSMIPDRFIPSALSSYLSSPMLHHNPFLPRYPAPPSLVSSPSHVPLDLPGPPYPGRRLAKKKSKKHLKGQSAQGGPPQVQGTKRGPGSTGSGHKIGGSKLALPPQMPETNSRDRPESTVPGDTTSEDESGTDGTKKGSTKQESTHKLSATSASETKYEETSADEDEEEDVWLEESSEDELDVEYHSMFIQNPSKRKRKWEQKWAAMVRLFQEIDRTTDSPMILLASPSTSTSPKSHILISRAMQRDPAKYMPHAQVARQSFSQISNMRRKDKQDAAEAERQRRAMGFEAQLASAAFLGARFDAGSGGSPGRGAGSSSPGSAGFGTLEELGERLKGLPTLAEGGEDGLKQALSVAIDSMKQMHMIYEQREERRREELERQRQETMGLENLWKFAAIGLERPNPLPGAGSPSSQGSGGGKLPHVGKKSP